MEVIIPTEPEYFEVPVRDLTITFVGGVQFNAVLRAEDQREDSADAITLRFAKSGEVVTIQRGQILYSAERQRTLREKKEPVKRAA